MSWMTRDLKNDTRSVFEKKYKRHLSDEEVDEIGKNLASLVEVIVKSRNIKNNDKIKL